MIGRLPLRPILETITHIRRAIRGPLIYLTTTRGTKLRRWGSVRQAAKVLGGCDRESIYVLIEAGLIDAYKLQPGKSNSHWRVDLVGCQRHRDSQMPKK